MKFTKKSLITGLLVSLMSVGVANATTINTTTPGVVANWSPIGEPNTATYGETFTVGADNQLNSFSLWLNGSVSASVDFAAYVYKWDGTKATGANLYTSAAQHFLGSQNNVPTEFAFSTGGIKLDAGSKYVAFLSASNFFDGVAGTASMPSSNSYSDVYAGGSFVYYNNGSDFSLLTNHAWNYTTGSADVWFTANLSPVSAPVPEPGTMMLLGMGMAALAVYGKRRQSNKA